MIRRLIAFLTIPDADPFLGAAAEVEFQPIGRGLDAIVLTVDHPAWSDRRMWRYVAARRLSPHNALGIRQYIGDGFKRAWRQGRRPNLDLIGRQMPKPLS